MPMEVVDGKKNDNEDRKEDIREDLKPQKGIDYLLNLPNTNRPFTVTKE